MPKTSKPALPGEKIIATNKSARGNYFIEEAVEAGLVLTGTEVKSLRAQAPNIRDSHVQITGERDRLEAWLINTHIAPYSHGNIWNHDPLRSRKLLLHRRQIDRLYGAVSQKGMTIVPTRMYFKNGKVKIELGIGRGKKAADKRETIRQRTAEREMARAMKIRR